MSNGIGRVWAVNAEGGDEGRPNGVGPVWIENADQLGSKLPEPESGDAGKVLGVLNSSGDIGWVVDQEGMAQVQADWDQADSSQVSYIANKPTIPSGTQLVPAATSADADKVLTVDSLGVPGWAVIPSQPTGLFEAVYNQTSFADISQAVADKRIVYCRVDQGNGQARMAFLAYVSSIAAEFQYYRSISSHSASTQTDEVYIYKVNADGWTTTTRKAGVNVTAGTHMSQSYSNDTLTLNATWPDVDQAYSASSTNAQSGTAVAGALATVDEVPAVTSSDDGKVLQATYSGGSGSYAWATPATVTVDQTYDASSANAQSGTAVAQAIAAIPSSSYSAGDGIQIDNDEVSVKADSSLSFEIDIVNKNLQAPVANNSTYSLIGQLDSGTVVALKSGTVAVKPLFAFSTYVFSGGVHFAICKKTEYNLPDNASGWLIASGTVSSATSGTFTMTVGDSYTADFSSLDAISTATWSEIEASPTSYYLQLVSYATPMPYDTLTYAEVSVPSSATTADVVIVEFADSTAPKKLSVANPLPTSAIGDAGRVLTVDAQGAPAWGMLGSVTSIQQVNALPASPDANTLYLIPEA